MQTKKSYISSLIIVLLFFILLINVSTGIIINSYIKNYKKYDSLIINKLGQIRGEIQRYTKLKIVNLNPSSASKQIDTNLHKVCEYVKTYPDIIPQNYNTYFFAKYEALKSLWEKIKNTNNQQKLITLSEKAWRVADKLTTYMQNVAEEKIKLISKKLYLITVLSSFLIVILIIFVYFKIREGLERASITDALTSLYNRTYFNEITNYLVEKFKRDRKPFSMVIFDIDNFKQINDTYGHQMGDEVLRKVGEIIIDNIRRSDFAFRYGGEEFVIIFPQTNLTNAINIVERIKNELSNKIQIDQKPLTVSGGVGEFKGEFDFKEFIEILDNALYKAKRTGKNKIISIA